MKQILAGRGLSAASGAISPARRSEACCRGHELIVDSGWREVCETALRFVQRFVR